jgi:hypothetical protein
MAKREIKGNEFTRCDAFWQPANPGEVFTGVLIDVNANMVDSLSGAQRPLYIFLSLGVKKEKCTLIVPQNADSPQAGKAIPNEKGLKIGVNDTYDIRAKLGEHLQELLGHEITLTFTEVTAFKKKGTNASRSLKRFKVEADDEVHSEFGSKAVMRSSPTGGGTEAVDAPNLDSEIPFD